MMEEDRMLFKTGFATLATVFAILLWTEAKASSDAAPLDALVEVGSGEMRWLGMEIYRARLLSGEGRFDGTDASGPLALAIEYRRNISSERLVRTTEREWDRLGRVLGLADRAVVAAWLKELAVIWPDVSPGDRITALVEPGGATHFYGNAGLLGSIPDPEFGPAFLGIWLHPDTTAASLRAGLLGAPR
jgi:hypothetical protein